jgi:NitT/TauT family transport system ATP-binding protein
VLAAARGLREVGSYVTPLPVCTARAPVWIDLLVILGAVALVFGMAEVASEWRHEVVAKIDEKRRHIAPVFLPFVTPVEVLGLLSVLGEHGRDVFELSAHLAKEFVAVGKAAELLGLVETPGQDVHMSPLGRQVNHAAAKEQRRLIREPLLKLKVFELLTRLIRVQPNQILPDDELLRELQAALPHEKPVRCFLCC